MRSITRLRCGRLKRSLTNHIIFLIFIQTTCIGMTHPARAPTPGKQARAPRRAWRPIPGCRAGRPPLRTTATAYWYVSLRPYNWNNMNNIYIKIFSVQLLVLLRQWFTFYVTSTFIIIFHIKPHLVRSAPDGALHTGIESSKEMQADVKVTVWQHRYDFYFSKTYCERLSSGPPSYTTQGTFVWASGELWPPS